MEGTERELVITAELAKEIQKGHPLHGKLLILWLACSACDDVLVRVHDKSAPAWQAHRYAVIHPTWSHRHEQARWPTAKLDDKALDALDRLETCFH